MLKAADGYVLPAGAISPRSRASCAACALPSVLEDAENGLPSLVRAELALQTERLRELDAEVMRMTARIEELAAEHEPCRRLMERRGLAPLENGGKGGTRTLDPGIMSAVL